MIVRKTTNYVIEINGQEVTLTEEQARSLLGTLKLELGEELIPTDVKTIDDWIKENEKKDDWPWPVSPWKEGPSPYGWPPTITFKSAVSNK